MGFKSILVTIPNNAADATASQEACRFALAHAKRNNGYVQALLVAVEKQASKAPPKPVSTSMMPQEAMGASAASGIPGAPDSSLQQDPMEQVRARAKDAFRSKCDSLGVEFTETTKVGQLPAASWQSDQEESLEHVIGREALGHDLTLLPAPSAVRGAEKAAKRILTDTGKPVLVMPPTPKGNGNGALRQILIAWDGGPQAWHAVSAALPLLKEADSVAILTVDPPADIESKRARLLHYLTCHGIDASAHDQPSRSLSVGEAVLGDASDGEYSLLVMGAYTRGPLREKLVGGATRHVLNHAAATPVFFAH